MADQMVECEMKIVHQIQKLVLLFKTEGHFDEESALIIIKELKNYAEAFCDKSNLGKNFSLALYSLPGLIEKDRIRPESLSLTLKFLDDIDELYGLILSRERPEERKSGVPRIF